MSSKSLAITQQRVKYGDQYIDYQVSYSTTRKHRVAIHVHPEGMVEVEAPRDATAQKIKQAVLKRASWVTKHLQDFDRQNESASRREYISGETHFYLGRRYQLKVYKRKQESVKLWRGYIRIEANEKEASSVKPLLGKWYRKRADEVFQRRLVSVCGALPWVESDDLTWKLLEMKKQWGSCSPKGVLSLNPHLVKAPRECIDYVLLHELCHLQEHNHSKRFYRLLDRYMPEWQTHKLKLDGMAGVLIH